MDAAQTSDAAYGSAAVLRSFHRRFPGEQVVYSAAAILVPGWRPLDGPSTSVIRGTRRGTLIVTPARLYFTTGGVPPLTLLWVSTIAGVIGLAAFTRAWIFLIVALGPALLLLQRLPAVREFSWEELESVELRILEGRIAPAYSIAVRTGNMELRFNTNKPVDGEASRLLQHVGVSG